MSRESFKSLHFIIHVIYYLYDIKRKAESLLQILQESWHKIILSVKKVSNNVISKNGMGKYLENLISVSEDINQG